MTYRLVVEIAGVESAYDVEQGAGRMSTLFCVTSVATRRYLGTYELLSNGTLYGRGALSDAQRTAIGRSLSARLSGSVPA